MHGPHKVRTASVAVLIAMIAAFVAPGVAVARSTPHRAGSTSYNFYSKTWADSGWKWYFRGSKSSFGSSLDVQAYKIAGSGHHPTQTFEWQFNGLANDDVMFAADLTPSSINTGADMGDYGTIKMSLKNPSGLSKSVSKCPSTGVVLATTYQRTGLFTGSFDFKSNASGLPAEVTLPKVGVTVVKTVYTGKPCSGGGGGSTCFPGSSFYGSHYDSGTSTSTSVSASKSKYGTSLAVSHSTYDAVNQVSIYASIRAAVAATDVVITANAVKLNGGALAPFGIGTLKLSKNSASTTTKKHCKTTSIKEVVSSGKITGKFATGDVDFNVFDSPSATIVKKI